MSAVTPSSDHSGQDPPPDSCSLGAPQSPSPAKRARIGYRTVYRHRTSNELIKEETFDTPQADVANMDHTLELVFEVVTTYLYIPGSNNKDNKLAIQSMSEPTNAIRIYSPAIANALRTVVQYYPDHDLDVDITIQAPYCILVHHYDKLKEYAASRASNPQETLCLRDRHVVEHIDTLIRFLDETVMEGVRAEMERNARGYYTYDHFWVSRKPGRTMIVTMKSEEGWEAGVIRSVSDGSFNNGSGIWNFQYWQLYFDGDLVSRRLIYAYHDSFDGEMSFDSSGVKIMDTDQVEDSKDPLINDIIEWGRIYCRLLENQCMNHSGQSPVFPYQQVYLPWYSYRPQKI